MVWLLNLFSVEVIAAAIIPDFEAYSSGVDTYVEVCELEWDGLGFPVFWEA